MSPLVLVVRFISRCIYIDMQKCVFTKLFNAWTRNTIYFHCRYDNQISTVLWEIKIS